MSLDVSKLCENVFVCALNKIVPPQNSNLPQAIYIKRWILKVVNLEDGTESKRLKKFIPVSQSLMCFKKYDLQYVSNFILIKELTLPTGFFGGRHGLNRMIYNYLCSQCILPLTLWVRILLKARCTWYNIMW